MSKSKKVIICMSTYNGEKYLKEQIESILNQTYKNIEIYVRDDGSTDETCKVLEDYEKKKKIHFVRGKNMGFIASFMDILKEAYGNGDYYAFADQDDRWHCDKIERAVNALESERYSDEKILLYFSNHDFCDEQLNVVKHREVNPKQLRADSAFFECIPFGMEMVFTKELASMILDVDCKQLSGHDWIAYITAANFGKVIYDNYVTVDYRRLNKSVSYNGLSGIRLFLVRIKKGLIGGGLGDIKKQTVYCKKYFEKRITNRSALSLFAKENSFSTTMKKVFYPKRLRQKMSDEVMLRILFLVGIL